MRYDGMGRRLVKDSTQGPVHTEYVYNGLDVIAEYTPKNSKNINYYRGEGNRIINSVLKTEDGSVDKFWYHYDALDTVVGLTKSDGQSNHNYRYDDFGRIVPENGNFVEPHNHYTYTGQEYDENTNLYEYYSRAYDPANGVWLQQDRYRGQITDPQSLLRYKYVDNDPIGKRDYYGYLDLLSPFTVSSEIYANQELFGRSETLSQQDARLAQETYMSTSALRRKLALQVREEICTEGRAGRLYWLQDQIDQIDLELKALAEKYGFAMEKSSENWRNIQEASTWWNVIPGVGAGFNFANAILGYDAFTGRELSGWDRLGQVANGFINIWSTATAVNQAGNLLKGGNVAKEVATAGDDAVNSLTKVDISKIEHIFGNPSHNLVSFVEKFGGNTQSAYSAIQNAANIYAKTSQSTGIVEVVLDVAGHAINVRGNIIDGVFKIGTAFIP